MINETDIEAFKEAEAEDPVALAIAESVRACALDAAEDLSSADLARILIERGALRLAQTTRETDRFIWASTTDQSKAAYLASLVREVGLHAANGGAHVTVQRLQASAVVTARATVGVLSEEVLREL